MTGLLYTHLARLNNGMQKEIRETLPTWDSLLNKMPKMLAWLFYQEEEHSYLRI
jgi:hypothetical protein